MTDRTDEHLDVCQHLLRVFNKISGSAACLLVMFRAKENHDPEVTEAYELTFIIDGFSDDQADRLINKLAAITNQKARSKRDEQDGHNE